MWWPAVAAITLAGLLLRLVAAHGGLWTDEAWSMIYAEQARDPAGVFLRINHDNNHHLIFALAPVDRSARAAAAWRGLRRSSRERSSIPAAALLLAPRSTAAAIAAAILFAVSPIMVTYGSEARGYALMLLAALVMLWLVIGCSKGAARRRNSLVDRRDRAARHVVASDDGRARRAAGLVGLPRPAFRRWARAQRSARPQS